MKKQRGITLVALVITVIIIIILSTVAINFLFGENGLITRAQQAAQMSDIENVREKLEMAKGTAVIDGRGYIDPDHYFDIIYEEGIIGDRENDVIDNGNGTYEVTTVEGYIFIITLLPTQEEVKDIDIEYSGTSEGPRIVSIKADGTTNSISIEVEARNAERATYTYEYSISGEEKWQEAEQSKNNTCTINNLTEGETYDIRVTVTTDEGSVTRGTSVHLGELPEGTITFKSEWVGDGTARVTINTSAEGYRLQYQINAVEENGWIDIDNGVTVSNLTYPSTVYARIFDGTNGSEEASETLEDKTAPQVTVTPNGTTSNSVSVSAAATDAQSGMKDSPTYTYSIKVTGQDDSTYTTPSTADAIASNSYTFTGLTQGTNYTVRVQVNGDVAGNIGTGTLANQTTGSIPGGETGVEQGAITFGNVSWSNGTASVTISTNTPYTIQYQIGSTSEEGWETGNSVSSLNHGQTVYARLWDGTQGGEEASIAIEDDALPTISNVELTSTENSVTVTVTAQDNESGIGNYTYTLNGGSQTSKETNTHTFTGLTASTTYTISVTVTDKANNSVTEGNKSIQTKEPPEASESTSYVGYYADVDGNNTVDGIIYADLAQPKSGQWNNSNGAYSYTNPGNLKKYKVEGTYSADGFRRKGIVKPAEGGVNERFYVMALDDVDSNYHCWYDDADGNMDDYASTTSVNFGSGEQNTINMRAKWNSSDYGSQNAGSYTDMWGLSAVGTGNWNGSSGWYVPSGGEWAAFASNLKITSTNYDDHDLHNSYWSSSQYDTDSAWRARLGFRRIVPIQSLQRLLGPTRHDFLIAKKFR